MKNLIYLISILACVLIVSCESCSYWLKDFSKREIDGKIIKKELNYKFHNSKYVTIKLKDGTVERLNFTGTQYDFLNYIQKEDLIYKESGSLKVKITRGGKVKYFTISCYKEGDPVPNELH